MASDTTNEMLIHVVLDRSGSMSSIREETISGFNVYLDRLRDDKDHKYWVSLTQFDLNEGPELTVTWADKPLEEIGQLTMADYQPRGGTPLHDAIGECIKRTESKGRAVTMVIITDGEENSSREYKLDDIKALVKQKEGEGWTFVFLGADIDSYATGVSGYGVSMGATANYQKTAGSVHALYANVAASTLKRAYSNSTRGVGETSTMLFFADEQKADIDPAFNQYNATVDPNQQATPTVTTTGSGYNTSSYWSVNAGSLVDPLGNSFPGVIQLDNQQLSASGGVGGDDGK
jgi:hypothetical protein